MSALLYSTKSGCMLMKYGETRKITKITKVFSYTSMHHNNILLRAAPGFSNAVMSPAKYGHFRDYISDYN